MRLPIQIKIRRRTGDMKTQTQMKKLSLLVILATCLAGFSSCYSTRILTGTVLPWEPTVKVAKVWNHHLIAGLIPIGDITAQAARHTNHSEDYIVETKVSFLNGLATGVTAGLYTPNTTIFYVPLRNSLPL
jgi:hypothetical protein